MQVVQLAERPWVPLIEEAVYGLLDDADGVVWPPMKVGSNLLEDVLRDIVEGVVCDHICRVEDMSHREQVQCAGMEGEHCMQDSSNRKAIRTLLRDCLRLC